VFVSAIPQNQVYYTHPSRGVGVACRTFSQSSQHTFDSSTQVYRSFVSNTNPSAARSQDGFTSRFGMGVSPTMANTLEKTIPQIPEAWRIRVPLHWDLKNLEYRSHMFLATGLVPFVRYTQDDPKERNLLFLRDFTSMTSSVMLYFFTQKALLKKLEALGWEESAKRRFYTHVPSQILSLTLSATVGPLFSQWVEKQVKAWQLRMSLQSSINTPSNSEKLSQPQPSPSSKATPFEKASQMISLLLGGSTMLQAKKQMMALVKDTPKTLQKALLHAKPPSLGQNLVRMSYTELPVWVLATELGALGADACYHLLKRLQQPFQSSIAPPALDTKKEGFTPHVSVQASRTKGGAS
jgi:hypothetical protein